MATTPAPQGEGCGTCIFFFGSGKDASKGNCFRYPPSTVYNPDALTDADKVTTRYPDVIDTDWCGEYQAVPV